jgi:3-deoxy-D-manno-octulosonic acid kinase
VEQAANQVVLLINQQILHVDLHPGNVLVDADGKVFLLDFDKAQKVAGKRNKLRDYYLCRWRRAVIKYNLPEVLSEMFALTLLRNFDGQAQQAAGVLL